MYKGERRARASSTVETPLGVVSDGLVASGHETPRSRSSDEDHNQWNADSQTDCQSVGVIRIGRRV
jgi:hypothetical protein